MSGESTTSRSKSDDELDAEQHPGPESAQDREPDSEQHPEPESAQDPEPESEQHREPESEQQPEPDSEHPSEGTEPEVLKYRLWKSEPDKATDEYKATYAGFKSQPLLEIDDKYCGIYPGYFSGQGHNHHASFGDNGTTASVSCYGDIMQISRYLGHGTSGVFSMDHIPTSNPYFVVDRASDLRKLSTSASPSDYSYGMNMGAWPTKYPNSIRWVNWRWPRFEWEIDNLIIIFQYFICDGVVLHQMIFHNKRSGNAAINLDPQLRSHMYIQDLNYLGYETSGIADEGNGPGGCGRVSAVSSYVVSDENTDEITTAATIDIFIDGKREMHFEPYDLTLKRGCTTEIVIAHRLITGGRSHWPLSWQDFMIPAEKANVSKLLEAEMNKNNTLSPDELLELLKPVPVNREKDAEQRTEEQRRSATSAKDTNNAKTNPKIWGGDDAKSHQSEDTTVVDVKQVDDKLEKIAYLTGRHLEHILSVCALPILAPGKRPDDSTPWALTCGDMSGHRVCTSASFYAFQFLIDIERRSARLRHLTSIKDLRERIQQVCKGHIMWLKQIWEAKKLKPFDQGYFAANYWVTGKETPQQSATWQPSTLTTDTAFQILKMTEYASVYCDDESSGLIKLLLTKVFVAWLRHLESIDYRERFAWPRSKQDGINTFRLEDHFWIWRALKAMEGQNMWKQLPSLKVLKEFQAEKARQSQEMWGELPYSTNRKESQAKKAYRSPKKESLQEKVMEVIFQDKDIQNWHRDHRHYDEFYTMAIKQLSPSEVQRGVLQRFTTLNDISSIRMLAVARSANDTRFLLHDRDTALIYDLGQTDAFLKDASTQALWHQTLEAQRYHPSNYESGAQWYTIMRYALSIMMGSHNKTLNTQSPKDAMQNGLKTLLELFNHNAFLGQHLDEVTREPSLFEAEADRDSYFHASFEVAYVLLTHAEYFQPVNSRRHDDRLSSTTSPEISKIVCRMDDILSALKAQPPSLAGHGEWTSQVMNDNITFNNHIVSKNINIFKEEWMYNYPEFLIPPPVGSAILPLDESQIADDPISEQRAFLLDARKHKVHGKRREQYRNPDSLPDGLSNAELNKRLGEPRTAQIAKKRFIWLPNANKQTKSLCKKAFTSEMENQAMIRFFQRHKPDAKYSREETNLRMNTWNSELHLSFYFAEDEVEEPQRMQESNDSDDLDDSDDPRDTEAQDHVQSTKTTSTNPIKPESLRRRFVGYRFHGDLFDRYWTCHFIESPAKRIVGISDADRDSLFPGFKSKDLMVSKTWWQRRFLELVLLQRTLDKLLKSTKSICSRLEKVYEEPKDVPQSGIWDIGIQWGKKLGEIHDDLVATTEKLDEWDDRGKHHGAEKPQWTMKDETRYRKSILERESAILEQRRGIEKVKARLKSLQTNFREKSQRLFDEARAVQERERINAERKKEQKEAQQEKKKADRDAHSERNIRWFTYVTIVFAPLSFAEGFYSMGGAPSHEMIGSLAKFSVVSLAITFVLLLAAINTLSALDEDQEPKESGEEKESGKEKEGPGFWRLLARASLDFLARGTISPAKIWARYKGCKSSARVAVDLTLSLPVAIICLSVFCAIWLLSFLLANIYDLCRLIIKELYLVPIIIKHVEDGEGGVQHKESDRAGSQPEGNTSHGNKSQDNSLKLPEWIIEPPRLESLLIGKENDATASAKSQSGAPNANPGLVENAVQAPTQAMNVAPMTAS